MSLPALYMEVLEFERTSFRHQGAKESIVHDRWGHSLARHDQIVNHVIDLPEAEEYDPALVRRLRRLRAQRAAQRTARREGWRA